MGILLPQSLFDFYRVLYWYEVVNAYNCVWTETYAAATATPFHATEAAVRLFCQNYRWPRVPPWMVRNGNRNSLNIELLRPGRTTTITSFNVPPTGPPAPRPTAPEAAFRIQRVGAAGGIRRIGRLCWPIPDDSFFTDLPHKRHVDTTMVAPYLLPAVWPASMFIATFSTTVYACIYDRYTGSGISVDSYNVLPNPVRIWKRWRRPHTQPVMHFTWDHPD